LQQAKNQSCLIGDHSPTPDLKEKRGMELRIEELDTRWWSNTDIGLQSQLVSVIAMSLPFSLVLGCGRWIEEKAEPLAEMPHLI